MATIRYFEIPADNIDRAKAFYRTLPGWKIGPATNLDPTGAAALQYHRISIGPAQEGSLNAGRNVPAADERERQKLRDGNRHRQNPCKCGEPLREDSDAKD